MRSIALLLLIFAHIAVHAQNGSRNELDELKKEIRQSTYYDSATVFEKGQRAVQIARKLGDLSEESTIYQYYGNFYYFSYNIEKAKEYYGRSMEIAKQAGNGKLVNSTRIRLAFMLADNDLMAAEREFQVLLSEARRNRYLENTTEIYNGLGNIYDSRQMKDQAMNYYMQGLRSARRSGNKYHQAMMLNNIGLLNFNNGQLKEAEKDFREGLSMIQGMNEDRLSLNLNNNLGLVNKELKNYRSSIKYYSNTLINAKKLGFPQGIGVAFLNLSDSYLQNGQISESINYADSALNILEKFQMHNYAGMAMLIKASAQLKKGHTAEALALVARVFELHKKHPDSNNIMEAHRVLSLIHESQGDYKKAYSHNRIYHEMKDSISEISNRDKLAELQVLYGKEKVESELENEKNKNALLNKENELKLTRIYAVATVAIFLLLLGIGAMYIRNIRRSRQQQKDFTQKLIENIDQERSRISKDLHDDIGQSLSVIKSKINLFNTGKTQNISGLDQEVGTVIEQTRSISHFLHPSFVAKLGLERSLVSLTEKTQESTGIVCSLSIKNDVESIPTETKTQIYRIIQECINNTLKHSGATALKISVVDLGNILEVTYRDNGTGISEQDRNTEGIGLMTIRERADSIGGKVVLYSAAGKGYKLTLNIPKG